METSVSMSGPVDRFKSCSFLSVMTKDNAVNYITRGQMFRKRGSCSPPKAMRNASCGRELITLPRPKSGGCEADDARCAIRDARCNDANCESGHRARPRRQISATSALRNTIEKH